MIDQEMLNMIDNVAEIDILYSHKTPARMRPTINTSRDAFEIACHKAKNPEYVENFYVILMNRANRVIGWRVISTGGIHGTVVDPKNIFQIALKANASSIILVHNHPSGNTRPSLQDENLTKKIVSGGQFLEISVLDHIIIGAVGDDGYYSFADEGMLKGI